MKKMNILGLWFAFFFPNLLQVFSFSCHDCDSVDLLELSEEEAKNYRNKIDRCVDFDGAITCMNNMKEGMCHLAEMEMKAKCNETCDLCRFKESGEMQSYDLIYWNTQDDFQETFKMINISLAAAESSSFYDNFGPGNVIDGNLTSYFESRFVSEPFIVVHLGGAFTVISVFIVNRWGPKITRQNIISLEDAQVSAQWIPLPGRASGVTGNQSFCGSIKLREGFITSDQQTYKVRCKKNPIATHIKLHREDLSKLELSEIKVGVVDHDNKCGYDMVNECEAAMSSDRCVKSELSGIWHGKQVILTQRRCHYPSQRLTNNCSALIKSLNKRWQGLKSPYKIEGAYDPNAFALTTCTEHICEGNLCNGAYRTVMKAIHYVCLILILFSF